MRRRWHPNDLILAAVIALVAAAAMLGIGEDEVKRAVPVLIDSLKDEQLKNLAGVALGYVAPKEVSLFPYRVRLLFASGDTRVRAAMTLVTTLYALDRAESSYLIPALKKLEDDKDRNVRTWARNLLKEINRKPDDP